MPEKVEEYPALGAMPQRDKRSVEADGVRPISWKVDSGLKDRAQVLKLCCIDVGSHSASEAELHEWLLVSGDPEIGRCYIYEEVS